MNRKTQVILCNYTKGGVGKTTLAVHVVGVLLEETIENILLMDCDPRADAWSFFSGSRPNSDSETLTLANGLNLRWNRPQSKDARFNPIIKQDYETYDYVVIDADAPPEDSLTILSDTLPDLFLVPIAESQSHAIKDMSFFLEDLEREINFENDSGIEYNPIIKIVPLGVSIEEIQNKVDISCFSVDIRIATPMKSLGKEIRTALEEKELVWRYPQLEETKNYFINLI